MAMMLSYSTKDHFVKKMVLKILYRNYKDIVMLPKKLKAMDVDLLKTSI